MSEITVPKGAAQRFGGKSAGSGVPNDPPQETPEQVAAKAAAAKAAEDAAAAAAAGDGAGGAGEPGGGTKPPGQEEIVEPDLTLIDRAKPELVESLEGIMTKTEDELTEDEKKVVQDNLDLITALANRPVNPIMEVMQSEGFLEEGEFEEGVEGYQGYMAARDEVRDKQVVDYYLNDHPEVKALAEHLQEKKPLITFLAQSQKPPILDTELKSITESMADDEKDAISFTYESVISANLRTNGMDSATISAVIEGAKAKGTLESMAKTSLQSMNDKFNSQIEEANKKHQDKIVENERAAAEQEKKTVDMIKNGKLTDSISIPASDRANFIQFLTTKINDRGDTLADQKFSELSLEEKTALDYIVYKGLKIPNMSGQNLMQKYRLSKKGNATRKPPPFQGGKKLTLGKLNLRGIAERKGII